jgi:hypothetical protein
MVASALVVFSVLRQRRITLICGRVEVARHHHHYNRRHAVAHEPKEIEPSGLSRTPEIDVQQHQIGPRPVEHLEGLSGVRRGVDPIPVARQDSLKRHQDGLLVIDDQDRGQGRL